VVSGASRGPARLCRYRLSVVFRVPVLFFFRYLAGFSLPLFLHGTRVVRPWSTSALGAFLVPFILGRVLLARSSFSRILPFARYRRLSSGGRWSGLRPPRMRVSYQFISRLSLFFSRSSSSRSPLSFRFLLLLRYLLVGRYLAPHY